MNNLQFIADLVQAFVWPITVVVMVLVFREAIIERLGHMTEGKFAGAEFRFEAGVVEVAKGLSLTDVAAAEPTPQLAERDVTSDPRGTVLNAWREVETAVRDFARRKGIVYANTLLEPFSAVKAFEKKGVLESEYISLLKHLGDLRNQAARQRDFVPSADSVSLYLMLAEALKAALRKAE